MRLGGCCWLSCDIAARKEDASADGLEGRRRWLAIAAKKSECCVQNGGATKDRRIFISMARDVKALLPYGTLGHADAYDPKETLTTIADARTVLQSGKVSTSL
jgi:hypothetical protein